MNKAKRAAGVAAVGSVTAATAVAVSSLNKAADFEAQMAKVSAVSSATATDFARLNEEAQKLGKSTVFSPTEAAKGMEYLALAGWKTDEIISAMLGMLNLAAAGALDLGRAADITSEKIARLRRNPQHKTVGEFRGNLSHNIIDAMLAFAFIIVLR
ncbi:phage tail tape measure protein [Lysinibacillus tabacifolii]|uniref:Phage tail tape measure protein n=2 Tax=Lysinibacillus tabacifolii TaxID=1173107 RepID=A0ABY2T3Z8_9BACI|nr:phage tail tape measure protein [Lysinibacillus tabacifolii]